MDLNSMYQNGMGSFASLNAGRQMASDRDMAAANLRAKQLENDNAAVMNPLNQQFKQGEIARQGAELPGIMGQSQSLGAQGQYDQQVLPTKIAARISQLGDQMGSDGMRKMARDGEAAVQTATMLKQYPPALHKEVAAQIFQKYGGDPNSPILKGIAQTPDANVAASLATVGKGMALGSYDYLQKSSITKQETDSHEKIAEGNNRTSIRVAEISAEARKAAATARASAVKFMNSDQKITFLSGIPEDERTPEEQAQLALLSKQRLAEHSAGANAVTPTILNQTTPTQNALSTADQIVNPQAAPSASPAASDIANAAKQAWGAYEPNKYQYRIGPNGKPQRAPLR